MPWRFRLVFAELKGQVGNAFASDGQRLRINGILSCWSANRRSEKEQRPGPPQVAISDAEMHSRLLHDREDVILGHDKVFFAVDNDFIARVGREQHAIAFL